MITSKQKKQPSEDLDTGYAHAYVLSKAYETPVETIWLEKTTNPKIFIVRSSPFYTHGLNYMDQVVAYKEKRANKAKFEQYNLKAFQSMIRVQRVKSHGGYMTVWIPKTEISCTQLDELMSSHLGNERFISTELTGKRISCAVHKSVYEPVINKLLARNIHFDLPNIEFDESF